MNDHRQPTIGLIGVGLLGTALAERLMGGGYAVLGFDLDEPRLHQLEQLGGRRAASSCEIARSCERILLSLPDSHVVATVVDEIVDLLPEQAILLDTTTGAPQDAESIAARLAGRGIFYLDATVAGSSQQARAGQTVMMVGGDQTAADRCQELLETLTHQRFFVGPNGSGARMKLVVNLVLGLNRAVLAEGLALARACGMDPATALQVLRSSPAHSAAMETKGPKMVQGDFTPQARLAQHRKDVQLILDLARHSQLDLPLSQVHAELLDRAIQLGFGQLDNSAVFKVFG